jgi:methylenetetrahydrofolate dehydrogenase (NADP+)/methenyltetrahydrofolate cyclohydrolase
VLCGDDQASATYVRLKGRAAEQLGIRFDLHTPPVDSTTADILDLVHRMNDDDGIDGMLVQLPLPKQIDPDAVLAAVRPDKDADGFHPFNFGRLAEGAPSPVVAGTPAGCMELLRRYHVPLRGSNAVVVGRSAIVGRPLALLLLNADCTVTICHSRTVDLASVCRRADILVAAVGRPEMVRENWIKPGAIVIDVGINRVPGHGLDASGKPKTRLVGDVAYTQAAEVAGAITPVPGGVGRMTIAMLMANTALAAKRSLRA